MVAFVSQGSVNLFRGGRRAFDIYDVQQPCYFIYAPQFGDWDDKPPTQLNTRHQSTPNPIDHRLATDTETLRHLAGCCVLCWLGLAFNNLRQFVYKLCIFHAAFLPQTLR